MDYLWASIISSIAIIQYFQHTLGKQTTAEQNVIIKIILYVKSWKIVGEKQLPIQMKLGIMQIIIAIPIKIKLAHLEFWYFSANVSNGTSD